MNAKLLALPTLCLGGAALLIAPLRPSEAFSKIGGSLSESQRDVRLFDNFLDTSANNNTTPSTQFPGYLGAELAIWKGLTEWASLPHGDGTGDPLSGNLLGDGGANFDAFWAGNANGIGTTNNNIVSSLADCGGGGTLAFTETPISDGWRIRFCDEWTWDDGPGTVSLRWDIQSVMTHEYGHALGLGHSTVSLATMAPSGSAGQTILRSIESDDIAGIQCVYGIAAGTKPVVVATAANSGLGTLTIYGSNFDASGNEVWFTNSAVTATSVDPIVRVTGVNSSGGGTVLSLSIPVGAGPGDVIVNKSGAGGATLSNAFPTDLVGTFGTVPGVHPNITSITPSSIEALIPGTAQTITITGTDLDLTTAVLLDLVAIPSSRYTIVDPNTITLDMPQTSSLGAHNLGVTDGPVTDEFSVTIVTVSTPQLEWGTGDAGNNVSRAAGLDMLIAGVPGEFYSVLGSPNGSPTLDRNLYDTNGRRIRVQRTIPAAGWIAVHLDSADLPAPALGDNWFAKSFRIAAPRPFQTSNDQTITFVP
jgi:hypothetical protein